MPTQLAPTPKTLRIELIDPLVDTRWQPFVEASPDASVFHHQEWLSLVSVQYRYPMLAHCVVNEDREMVAALPFAHIRSRITGSRFVSVPFSDRSSPVSRDGSSNTTELLVASIREQHERDGIDVEIRCPIRGLNRGSTFYQHDVELGPDLDAVRARFASSTRRAVAKAERNGVEVVRATDQTALDEFYRLHLTTRRRQGVPTQPRRFIRRFEQLFERQLGFVLLARCDGETAAAAVFLSFNGTLIYKYGASSPAHLNQRPNNALFLEAIRWGCANGYASLDLGRTDLDNEGLRSFKRGWGADEHTLNYALLARNQTDKARVGVPTVVRSLISRTPPITGRLVGEAMYRHFG